MSSSIEQRSFGRDNARYRREEFTDGVVVQVTETHRRRRRSPHHLPDAIASRQTTSSSAPSRKRQSTRDALLPSRPVKISVAVIAQQSLGGAGADSSLSPEFDSAVALDYHDYLKGTHGGFSDNDTGSQTSIRSSEPPSMPPTPRLGRLPSPDLPPLKLEVFCPCCSYRTTPIDLWAEFEDETLGGVGVLEHRA